MARKTLKTIAIEAAKTDKRKLAHAIPAEIQLKWGLALLGEEKALEYLKWLTERLEQHTQ